MEITQQMVEEYAKHHGTSLEDGSQEPGIRGTLVGWSEGQGTLDADLVNGNPTFAPIVEAYYKAKGQEVPESVKVPLTPTDDGTTDIMAEKLPDAEAANT